MNDILVLLYLADVVSGLSFVLAFSGLLGVLGVAAAAMVHEDVKILKSYLWIPAVFLFIATLIPSKQFLYIAVGGIATERVVGKVAESEIGQKVWSLVNQKIDEALASEGKKK